MAGQQVPGPQGVYSSHPLTWVDSGTLARTATPCPGISGYEFPVAGEPESLYRSRVSRVAVLSEKEKRTVEQVIAFCRNIEDYALIKEISGLLNRDGLGFSDMDAGTNGEYDHMLGCIKINRMLVDRIAANVSPTTKWTFITDLAAAIAHELEHRRQGIAGWGIGALADANRIIGQLWDDGLCWAVYGGVGTMGVVSQLTSAVTMGGTAQIAGALFVGKKLANWTVGNINQNERAAWQVGMQKRLTWARHEYQHLKQLQARHAPSVDQKTVAERLEGICRSFNDMYGSIPTAQVGILELQADNGKNLTANNFQQEIEGYLKSIKNNPPKKP
jgi:hypothetical protein